MATYASIPVAAEVQTVSVTAPATLMAGYTFDTIVDGVTMTVQVVRGKRILLYLYHHFSSYSESL